MDIVNQSDHGAYSHNDVLLHGQFEHLELVSSTLYLRSDILAVVHRMLQW